MSFSFDEQFQTSFLEDIDVFLKNCAQLESEIAKHSKGSKSVKSRSFHETAIADIVDLFVNVMFNVQDKDIPFDFFHSLSEKMFAKKFPKNVSYDSVLKMIRQQRKDEKSGAKQKTPRFIDI